MNLDSATVGVIVIVIVAVSNGDVICSYVIHK